MLVGKYRVARVLGAGAMGIVVAAHHVQLDTKVAIKLLLPELLGNAEAVTRFDREAKAVARMTSEHVARILDVGTLENGVPYMVMEYLDGEDLAERIERKGPLEIEQAVEFVLHACVAVAEAHGLGVVHRDLKPANLFCIKCPDGQLSIKVLDFGISKITGGEAVGQERLAVTKNLDVIGSPLYMSPEQMKASKHADAQSDIWALGVILYELIAGQVPFIGESETEVIIKVSTEPPRPLRGFRPEVPPRLEAVILKCLEKDRAQRYLNVADLACDLASFAPARAYGAIERITGTIEAGKLSNSGSGSSVSTRPPAPSDPGGADVDVEFDSIRPPEPDERRGAVTLLGQTTKPGASGGFSVKAALAAATAVGLIVTVGAGVFLVRSGALSSPPVAAPSAVVASRPTPATPSPEESAAPAGSTEVAIPPPVTPAPSTSALAAAQQRTQPKTGTAPAPAPHVPAKAPASAKTCDPPYVLDGEGRKHFKPECF